LGEPGFVIDVYDQIAGRKGRLEQTPASIVEIAVGADKVYQVGWGLGDAGNGHDDMHFL
jgi:hypothetical protein